MWHSDQSTFYRKQWKTSSRPTIQQIPTISQADLQKTSFNDRLYKQDQGYVKVVDWYEHPFLIARGLKDIAQEAYGAEGDRPLVLFTLAYEGIEKSLWCFEHNRLPLISEKSARTTAQMAAKYHADALICDSETLRAHLPSLNELYGVGNIKHLDIIDSSFDLDLIQMHFRHATVTLRLGLPEAGVFATGSMPEGKETVVFKTLPHALLQEEGSKLAVTRLLELHTPIIRYQTDIDIKDAKMDANRYITQFNLTAL